MNRCADCRHWRSIEGEQRGDCALASSHDGEPDVPTSKARAEDGEGYFACLDTAPDFGCVQWESEEEP